MTSAGFESALKSGRSIILIDVRSVEATVHGRPAGAIHAPAAQFMDYYTRLGLNSILKASEGTVVLCESDRCSAGDQIAQLLKSLGHQPLYVFEGGWESYLKSGLRLASQ